MKELGRVTFSPDTTSGGGGEREREREREIEKRRKERKETKTVCHGLRRRDVKVPCHPSRCVQRSHIHTHDHTYTRLPRVL